MVYLSKKKGFTLIELMIAVVIVGIITMVAYPAYRDQMYKSRRSDGRAALMTLASYMESYYTENNNYTSATLAVLGLTNTSPQGYYTVSLTVSATSYTLTATPVGVQGGDSCGALTLTNTNIQGPNISCWQ